MFSFSKNFKRFIPNFLSLFRLTISPIVGFLLWKSYYCYASFLYSFGAITDFLDGYIARKFSLTSEWGKVLDPVADKFLILIPLVVLYFLKQSSGEDIYRPPLFLMAVLILKELFIIAGSVYFLTKKGKIPGPNLLGKFSVANLLVYLNTILILLCFGMIGKLKTLLDFWGNLIALTVVFALILYTVQFLKIRKEPWERR